MGRFIWMALAGLTAIIAALLASPAQAFEDVQMCSIETTRQEKLQGIPDHLLHAISLVESGRWDKAKKASFAWPWTVMAEGEGRFLPSKAAAIAEVRKLQARGVRNIDVGCMQVNLLAHKGAFASLEEAFEPATNVAYAARFLVGLYASTQNWPTAGAYYHSQTPSEAAPYKAKLLTTWNTAKGQGEPRVELAILENRPPVGMWRPTPRMAATPVMAEHHTTAAAAAAPRPVQAAADEARQIANAYRTARLEEYRLRRAQMAKG